MVLEGQHTWAPEARCMLLQSKELRHYCPTPLHCPHSRQLGPRASAFMCLCCSYYSSTAIRTFCALVDLAYVAFCHGY